MRDTAEHQKCTRNGTREAAFDVNDQEHETWRAEIDRLVAQHLTATVDLTEINVDAVSDELVPQAS